MNKKEKMQVYVFFIGLFHGKKAFFPNDFSIEVLAGGTKSVGQ